MKTIAIPATDRKELGSKDAAQLRREERIPGVVYGGKDNTHFSMREIDLKKLTHTTETNIVELDMGGRKQRALLKEVQYHPVTDRPLHVDFIEITEGKPSELSLSVRVVGQSVGVRLGGRLTRPLRNVRVIGLVDNLPEELEIDVTDLKVGDSIRISDLKTEGIKFLGRPDAVVAAVKTARAVIEEVVAEEEGDEEGAVEGAPADGAPSEGTEGAEGGDKPAPPAKG